MRSMDSNAMYRMMWQAIKPLLMGKILYTPHTPATQRIIHEVHPPRAAGAVDGHGDAGPY